MLSACIGGILVHFSLEWALIFVSVFVVRSIGNDAKDLLVQHLSIPFILLGMLINSLMGVVWTPFISYLLLKIVIVAMGHGMKSTEVTICHGVQSRLEKIINNTALVEFLTGKGQEDDNLSTKKKF